ncbi:hypothetical protein LguiB_000787 [Lonicera macranthoides]
MNDNRGLTASNLMMKDELLRRRRSGVGRIIRTHNLLERENNQNPTSFQAKDLDQPGKSVGHHVARNRSFR